jgi:hypothetical protein
VSHCAQAQIRFANATPGAPALTDYGVGELSGTSELSGLDEASGVAEGVAVGELSGSGARSGVSEPSGLGEAAGGVDSVRGFRSEDEVTDALDFRRGTKCTETGFGYREDPLLSTLTVWEA